MTPIYHIYLGVYVYPMTTIHTHNDANDANDANDDSLVVTPAGAHTRPE